MILDTVMKVHAQIMVGSLSFDIVLYRYSAIVVYKINIQILNDLPSHMLHQYQLIHLIQLVNQFKIVDHIIIIQSDMKVRLSLLVGSLFVAISLVSESWKPIAQELILIFTIREQQLRRILITSDIVFIALTLLIFAVQKYHKCSLRNVMRRNLISTGLFLSCLVLGFGFYYWASQSTFEVAFITAVLGGALQAISFVWLLQFLQAGLLEPISVILIWYLAPNISLLFGKIIGSETVSNSRRPHKNFEFFQFTDFQKNFLHFKDLIMIGVGIGVASVILFLILSCKQIRQFKLQQQREQGQGRQSTQNGSYLKKFAILGGIIVGLQYATDLQTQIVHYRFVHLNYSHVDMKQISALADFLLVSFIIALLFINRRYEERINKTNTIYTIAILTLWTQLFWIFYLKYGNLSIFTAVLHKIAIAMGFLNRMFISMMMFPIANEIKRLMKQDKTRYEIITIFSVTLITVKTVSYIFMTYSLHVFLFVFFFTLTMCFSLLHILLAFKDNYKTINEEQDEAPMHKQKGSTSTQLQSQGGSQQV